MRVPVAALSLLAGTLACRADAPAEPGVSALVRQLGDADHAKRSQAEKALFLLDEKAIPLLQEARRSEDLEVAARAQGILKELSSFPCQLRRWARKGVREEFLGERWFVAYEDGQPRMAIGVRLDRAPEERDGYSLRLNFGGSCDIRAEVVADFSVRSYTVSLNGGAAKLFAPVADPDKAALHPELLIWFCPFWEIQVREQELFTVNFQDLNQRPVWTLLTRHEEEDVACPGGHKRGESIRLRGASVTWQVWWDAQKRLIKILGTGGQEYFPVTRGEAAKVAGGLEWWK